MKTQESSPATNDLEKKNEAIGVLDKQVTVIKKLLLDQQRLAGSDVTTASEGIIAHRQEALELFGDTVVAQRQKYKKSLIDLEALGFKIDELENRLIEEDSETLEEEVDKLKEQYFSLDDESQMLYIDEVSFLDYVEAFFDRLQNVIAHNAALRKKKTSKEDISVYLDKQGKIDGRYAPKDVVYIEEDAFSTAFIIDQKKWGVSQSFRGFFVPKTNFVFARTGLSRRQTKSTLDHERMHHVLDGIDRYTIFNPTDLIRSKMERFDAMHKHKAPRAVLDSIVRDQLLSEKFVRTMINATQNEFLAAYEDARRFGFAEASPEMKLFDVLFNTESPKSQSEIFQNTLNTLSTAGVHIRESHAYLESIVAGFRERGYEEYAQLAEKQVKRYEEQFLRMIDQVREAAKLAPLLGTEADVEVKALLILLRPTDYRHIMTYLKSKYREEVAFIGANKIFFSNVNVFVNQNSLRSLMFSLRELKKPLPEKTKHSVAARLERCEVDTPEELKNMFTLLDELEGFLIGGSAIKPGDLKRDFLINLLSEESSSILDKEGCRDVLGLLPENYLSGEFSEEDAKYLFDSLSLEGDNKSKMVEALSRIGVAAAL